MAFPIAVNTHIQAEIRALWPDCPDAVVRRYISSLASPAASLIAGALFTLKKPYGLNHIVFQEGEYGVALLQMLPGQSSSFHHHTLRKEFLVVRSGRLTIRFADRELQLGPGECGLTVPPVAHAASNREQEPLEVLELISPFLLDDKIRIEDRYQRKLGSVTHLQ